MKKGYFKQSFQAAIIISTSVTIEVVVPILIYIILNLFGVSKNVSLFVAVISFIVLIILSLPFIPTPVFLLSGKVGTLTWKLPTLIRKQLSRLLSIPKEFLNIFKFFTLIVFILGSIFLLLGILEFTHDQQIIMNGQITTATIIDCTNQPTCVPIVQFETKDGRQKTFSTRCCAVIDVCVLGRCASNFVPLGEGNVELKKGDKISVIYNSSNPSEVQVQVKGSTQTDFTVQTVDFLTYGIFLIVLALLCSLLIFSIAISKFLVSHIINYDADPIYEESKKDFKSQQVKEEESHFR